MFCEDINCHHIRHTVLQIDIWSNNSLMEPCDRNTMGSLNMAKGWGTTRAHNTGRGLVVLIDIQDYLWAI